MSNCCNCMGYHEQNLDWFLSEIKKALAEWDSTEKNIAEFEQNMTTSFEELKDYVTNYFKQLDISAEVSAKINELIENGQFEILIEKALKEYYSQPFTFFIAGGINTNTDYDLYVTQDLKSYNKVQNFHNFIKNSPVRLGTEWAFFKYEDYYCWAVTAPDSSTDFTNDVIVVTTKDMINFTVGVNLVGFRNASTMNGYVWTPRIFTDGTKWYCAATVQTGETIPNGDKYGYSSSRNCNCFYCEISFDPSTGKITPNSIIKEMTFPTGKHNIDAVFEYKNNRWYCLYSDRYTQTIISCVSDSLDDEFLLLNDNVFNCVYIEAPQIYPMNNGNYYIIGDAYSTSPFHEHEYTIGCYTNNFTDYWGFQFIGCVAPEFSSEKNTEQRRMRNPSLFYLPYDIMLNVKNTAKSEIEIGSYSPPKESPVIPLDQKVMKMIKENTIAFFPNSKILITENVDITGFKYSTLFGASNITCLTSHADNFSIKRNTLTLNVNSVHEMLYIQSNGDFYGKIDNIKTLYTKDGWNIRQCSMAYGANYIQVSYEGTGSSGGSFLIHNNIKELINCDIYFRTTTVLPIFYGNSIKYITLDLNTNGQLYARGIETYEQSYYGSTLIMLG